eukprot:611043-Prorocentrum_lima.AAC.1
MSGIQPAIPTLMLGTGAGERASAPASRQGYEPNRAGRHVASALRFSKASPRGRQGPDDVVVLNGPRS